MIFPKAAPMITPTARSITLPLNAKVLNSSKSENAFFVGSNDESFSTPLTMLMMFLLFVAPKNVKPLSACCLNNAGSLILRLHGGKCFLEVNPAGSAAALPGAGPGWCSGLRWRGWFHCRTNRRNSRRPPGG